MWILFFMGVGVIVIVVIGISVVAVMRGGRDEAEPAKPGGAG